MSEQNKECPVSIEMAQKLDKMAFIDKEAFGLSFAEKTLLIRGLDLLQKDFVRAATELLQDIVQKMGTKDAELTEEEKRTLFAQQETVGYIRTSVRIADDLQKRLLRSCDDVRKLAEPMVSNMDDVKKVMYDTNIV